MVRMRNTNNPTWDLTHAPALVRVLIGAAVGGCAAAGDVLRGPLEAAPLVGWDALALTYLGLTWWLIWPLNPGQTARRATRHDPTRAVSYVLLMSAALASLLAVGLVLFQARHSSGTGQAERVGFGVASVVLSWAMVHTVYTLRYATVHYTDPRGGVDFNQRTLPSYRDFAYLAFTIGMTFQVSDTALTTSNIRRTALLHALSAYALATVILAAAVNLIAGLSH
jgi:uncharacterized membrane protein